MYIRNEISPLRSAVVNPMIIFALLFVAVTLDAETEISFLLSILRLIVESRVFVFRMLSRVKAEGKEQHREDKNYRLCRGNKEVSTGVVILSRYISSWNCVNYEKNLQNKHKHTNFKQAKNAVLSSLL